MIREYQRQFEKLQELLTGRPVLSLTYENDIEKTPQHAYERTSAFLGIEAKNLDATYSRTNPFALQELITNFEEVREALKGTEVEWMLSDCD